ncbi:hypothetical protein RRG08_029356 [Elysia crispata]|uniref:Uncharacterized protein n=1 Tax=Elysia crispata TaxID=231223 RepID=A0AAE1B967_9GAST|nr:hypothetical protein RRG08_029356 [Elysia crispata]
MKWEQWMLRTITVTQLEKYPGKKDFTLISLKSSETELSGETRRPKTSTPAVAQVSSGKSSSLQQMTSRMKNPHLVESNGKLPQVTCQEIYDNGPKKQTKI